eukprot:5586906-Prymnesium_polylepis.1
MRVAADENNGPESGDTRGTRALTAVTGLCRAARRLAAAHRAPSGVRTPRAICAARSRPGRRSAPSQL